MNVGELCTRDVIFAGKDETVLNVARLMRHHHVGDVVIVEERDDHRVPVGIVTDRDLVVELLAEEADIGALTAGDIMGAELLVAREDDGLWDTLERMRVAGVRRLPVVDGAGRLAGILTLDDLVELLAEGLEAVARTMGRELRRERRLRE